MESQYEPKINVHGDAVAAAGPIHITVQDGGNVNIGEAPCGVEVEGEPLSEEAQRERTLKEINSLLSSPAVLEVIKLIGKRIEAAPDREVRDHERHLKSMELNAKYYRDSRIVFGIGLVVCLSFLGTIVWILKGDKETLLPVLTALVGLLAGAGGGYIFGQSKPANE